MDSESQIALLLAQVDAGIKELEHTVENFEQAVSHAELCMNEAEVHVHEELLRDEAGLQLLTRALRASQDAATLARASNTALDFALTQAETAISADAPAGEAAPLPPGTLICDGRYRLVQLLHSRPRLHLYLARRLANSREHINSDQPLVAIREIILAGLAPSLRQQVVRAAFEEFAAPQLFGSPHLAGVGDHLYLEDGRHYLIMQPRQAHGNTPAFAQPLSERLSDSARLDISTALHLGTRLCQTVARLHRLHLHLGELMPSTILVDRGDDAHWAPIILASWPPAPYFWPGQGPQTALRTSEQIFPTLEPDQNAAEQEHRAFAAPEIFAGQRDARSDVYALGAILYLLCTGYAPATASQRQRDEQTTTQITRVERPSVRPTRPQRRAELPAQAVYQDATLISPRLLNPQVSPLLEQILLRSLALNPEQRFASARDLAEALETMHLKTELPITPVIAPPFPRTKASRLRRMFEWLKR
ncbi:MAG TPA: hypothetical protein VN729_01335 [Ktedonobacteraceae bacterium]|nr:hypothetical protein [Ktedonobacteraceae bacterium]